MTFEDYMEEIRKINSELGDIAERTMKQAALGIANASNSGFVALMRQHANLTKRSHQLTEAMMKQLEIDN
ncbi:hypothetical protein WJF72_002372 [Klebsiella aerogenes]|nr:hypothetical protein [Klebsiella aerogenes]